MRYQGGKSRIGKYIAQAILDHGGRAPILWEPFCGGCGATPYLLRVADRLICSDLSLPVISMWQALLDGWDPPEQVSEDEYRQAKSLPDTDPLKAFIGYGCSFGGKWFGGYARNAEGKSYAAMSKRSMRKTLDAIRGHVTFAHWDFVQDHHKVGLRPGSVVYCDQPYRGTTGYGQPFDHDMFWIVTRNLSEQGLRVYVSEYSAPADWVSIWGKQLSTKSGLRTKNPRPPEQLFTRTG